MSPIQQMLLGVGAVATKTYVDDIFSTYVYTGTGSTRSINNGIDQSGEGSMTWIKARSNSETWALYDTERGATKRLKSSSNATEETLSFGLTGFTTTGFTHGNDNTGNDNDEDYLSWTFRKAPGFFDVVTWTGNDTARTLSHSLGCIPGMIMIKNLTDAHDWVVYHRSLGATKSIELNNTSGSQNYNVINSTAPTASVFSLGTHGYANANGKNYVAYLFAGGESTAATARSVEFDGSGDYLTIPTTSNMEFATGDYTIDFWFKRNATGEMAIYDGTDGGTSTANRRQRIYVGSDGKIAYYDHTPRLCTSVLSVGTWNHVAVTRASGTSRIFINGTLEQSWSSSGDNHKKPDSDLYIGRYVGGSGEFNGSISNLRMIKGHAAYTSSFIPPTEPPTSTSDGAGGTDVKFLGCNDSSVTGAHINLLNTITANGDPTASTDSPFDDPAAHVFGESGSESVIKCGSYVGNGSETDGPVVNLGWEPQWIMVKGASQTDNWWVVDCIRGIITGDNSAMTAVNTDNVEYNLWPLAEATPTGFRVLSGAIDMNVNNGEYIFCAIRRPDGYVGKPPELGTGVFAMDGTAANAFPSFESGFPVDFALDKKPAASGSWEATARLLPSNAYLKTESNSAESTYGSVPGEWKKDSNTGFGKSTWNGAGYQAWMWKRHAGFDVVTDTAGGVAKSIPHSLGKVPEMIWRKSRSNAHGWTVYHKGLNGGTTPQNYYLQLSSSDAEGDNDNVWNDTAPTSTHFTVGNGQWSSDDGATFITMLFASVSGISKVGSYTGNGTSDSSTQTITTGFQPRFVIIKSSSHGEHWVVFDTTRGWSSGSSDQLLELNNTDGQTTALGDLGHPISTGFVLEKDESVMNLNGHKYIYYAHA